MVLHAHWGPTLAQEGTALMSLSMGEVSARGPFFTCARSIAVT